MRACLIVAALAGSAHAFPTGSQFDDDPVTRDGGGGIAFDGAPRWTGHTCEVCHTDAPHAISIKLESSDASLFTDGWQAGTQYHLRVRLLDEHEGLQYANNGEDCGVVDATPFKPCDDNGFAIELDDSTGNPVGKYQQVQADACTPMASDPRVHPLQDGTAVLHEEHNATTAWDLCWTAPAAGTGPITAYIAVVDGNGGDGTAAFPNDTKGDDVAAGAVPMPELGGGTFTQGGGCDAAGDAGIAVVLVMLVLVIARRRMIAIVLAVAALAGCVHVRPRQRETLAKRNMKFGPDPAEDELDLHMQESREGSSGGYGSSGGGCGCN